MSETASGSLRSLESFVTAKEVSGVQGHHFQSATVVLNDGSRKKLEAKKGGRLLVDGHETCITDLPGEVESIHYDS